MKRALITGITGQDGSYLSRLLLNKGYEVHGIKRRSSSFNTSRIDDIYEQYPSQFYLHYGDLTDSTNIIRLIYEIDPDEIYNLGAQSHVAVSFETPEYTAQSDALGPLRILEGLRILDKTSRTRFYQASTSELYGNVIAQGMHDDTTAFQPRSPYAAAKLYAYWITRNYREAYGVHASNGILFNHESPLRGETFVTRKISRAVARIYAGIQDTIFLGNLDAYRDWGYAGDYVKAMWLITQYYEPRDWIVATGISHSVREFVECAFAEIGISLIWRYKGIDEEGINENTGKVLVRIDPRYFRPTEVDFLCGNAEKTFSLLGWKPEVDFYQLVRMMVRADITLLEKSTINIPSLITQKDMHYDAS